MNGFAVACLLLTSVAHAQKGVEVVGVDDLGRKVSGEKWAVVVGCNAYDSSVGALKYAVRDARAFRDTLAGVPGGVPAENISLLVDDADPKHTPTRTHIIEQLTAWLKLAENPNDMVVFYFSGHGTTKDGATYLLPVDASMANPTLTGIPLSYVLTQLRDCRAKRKVVFLDACHSGAGRDLGAMSAATEQEIQDAEGLAILASCQREQKSYEWEAKQQGAFTYFLNEALRGQAERDGDGLIGLSEVNRYVDDAVKRWAASEGIEQRPRANLDVSGEIFLARAGGAFVPPPVVPTRPTPPVTQLPSSPGTIGTKLNPVDGAELVFIPGGTFQMGSNDGDDDEKPVHQVTVSGFWMYAKEVTNGQYRKFLAANPEWTPERIDSQLHDGGYLKHCKEQSGASKDDSYPVAYVPWHAAKAYAEWAGGRLPTEAEWEYAARGGRQFEYGTATGELSEQLANYGAGTKPVGSYRPNPFGLYDLAGNVWEWCQDWYGEYPDRAVSDPQGASTGVGRVARGGSWNNDPRYCRSGDRNRDTSKFCIINLGFRPVLAPPG